MSNKWFYSEEVKEHFFNPKNIIKSKEEAEKFNADGVGIVGNPKCLLPYERIHTDERIIEISKLKKRQKVLTHTGEYSKISKILERDYKGKAIKFKNKLGNLTLTPDHLVYGISVPKGNKSYRNKHKKTLIPSWYHAEHLKKNDLLLYPIYKTKKDKKFIKIEILKSKWDFKSKEVPNKIPVNSKFLRLLGYFLSEGNVQDKPSKAYISFSLNINEKEIVEDIKKISESLFNLEIKITEYPKNNCSVVHIYNAKLARFFLELCGNGAANKKIPSFVMDLPIKKQEALLFGLWKGHGYVNIERTGPRAGYATTSYQLAQQIKTLLLRQKIAPSLYTDNGKKVKGISRKTAYRIHIGQRDSLKKLCKILKLKYCPKSYESIESWFDNNYFYTPITTKKLVEYEGKVHNLEVEKAHSYVSESASVHNCGDMMKMWIKVDKGIITDCKYQTFGCASAIATTSVLSEMVKGMKVEDAFKITPKEIVEKLGGLPAIKFHCSVLGDKALREAINDYYRRTDQIEKIVTDSPMVDETLRITERDIENAVIEGAKTLEDVQARTKAGLINEKAIPRIKELIKIFRKKHSV